MRGATAGFAERHSELRYGERAALHWIHPGDGCDSGNFCFRLVRKDAPHGSFRGLNRAVIRINAPAEAVPPRVFAQACEDEHWIVYDLAAEDFLAATPSSAEALGAWAVLSRLVTLRGG